MPNFEKYAWLFMRMSGVVLVFLALGHLFVMLMWQDGVYRIDFNYVAQRWHSPFWQTWDLLLLWLAQLHGGNGLRTIIDDYSRKDSTRFWLNTLLALSMAFTLVWSVGAFTLFYVYLMLRRLQLAELEEGLEERELELAIAERQRVEQMVTV